ncbi:MAG: GTPase Era [Deltaproteobacteria bacterium]|nr:GTPase Era [Deltaproteobacteria bacterium]
MPPFKSGFVSIIGRPNVGKSTLLNTILGEKIAIVSPKPQTTRNRIRGIKNMEDAQIIFLDTPGIHSDKGYLNEFMIREAISAIEDVDVIIYLVEASKTLEKDDSLIIDNLRRIKSPVLLGINKTDITRKDNILPLINEYSKLYPFKEIIPISATRGEGIETLVKLVVELLPEGPKYFPEDILTDLPERFIVAEIVREKIFKLTRQEIPYSTAVVIDSFKENPKLVPAGNKQGKGLVSISATINVERDSQKGIIIGKGGKMLKEIGTLARIDIEKLLGAKVYLELFVKVEKDWTKDKKLLKEFGYH